MRKNILMLKIGVLGAGHLGKIHINCIKQLDVYDLVGFYDQDENTARKVSDELQIKCYKSLEELVDLVDVVDIVTPTVSHFECASLALKKGKHVFIEKPVVATVEEANRLIELADEARVKVQVGHVERFNPAYIAARPYIDSPLFIEAHRLALFNPRGTDVPVVLDLMVHDVDIVLDVIKSPIESVHVSGVSIVSPTPDITNARIEFKNGSVANLTASRISLKNMRKHRIFQKDAYITVDFLEKKTDIVRIHDVDGDVDPFAMTLNLADGSCKQITIEQPEVIAINAIMTELESFNKAIVNNTEPPVTIQDGVQALKVCYMILDEMSKNKQIIQKYSDETI